MESVAVSIVAFNGEHLLRRCLDCVLAQTYPPTEIVVLDNASQDGTVKLVRNNFPAVRILSSPLNLGFGGGHNRIIRQTKASFVLVLNQDAFLSPTFLQEIMAAVLERPEVGIAGGKLYSLRETDAEGANVVDMTWLDLEKRRRQVCYAHGLPDREESRMPRFVFAIDGAATLLRREMLEDVEIDGEYYDEDFFAGKEDLDLSWRAQLYGWKCLYVPSAIGKHVRTFTPRDRRSTVAGGLRTSSVRNRYLLMLKNDLWKHFVRHFPQIAIYDLKILAYILLYERSSLWAYAQTARLIPKALHKRKVIMSRKRVGDEYILQWFR